MATNKSIKQNEIIKQVDEQGRIVIPKKWRNEHLKESSTVKLEIKDDEIVLRSYQPVDVTKYFNSIKANIRSNLDDWDAVKKELLKKSIKENEDEWENFG